MSEPAHDILRFKRCPKCDYDVRFVSEPRCPECGERFEAEMFDLSVWPVSSRLQNRKRKNRHAVTFTAAPAIIAILIGLNRISSASALFLLAIVPAAVHLCFVAVSRIRYGRSEPHLRLYFMLDGVFIAAKRDWERVADWNRVRSIDLKYKRRRRRWRITLGGNFWSLFRSSETHKFEIDATADDVLRVAVQLREFREAAQRFETLA